MQNRGSFILSEVPIIVSYPMKAYNSVKMEVLIEFWVPMKLVRLIKMCPNEM
jgi:hypothetical protein